MPGNKKAAHGNFDASLTRGLAFTVHPSLQSEVQYLDLKQITEILYKYRNRVRAILAEYRTWRTQHARQYDEVERIYSAYEGHFLRGQIRDCLHLYYAAHRDYHAMRRIYLGSLKNKRMSSLYVQPRSHYGDDDQDRAA